MSVIAYLTGHTLARLADPILVIIAAVFGLRTRSRLVLVMAAIGASFVTPVLLLVMGDGLPFNPLLYLLSGVLASAFWFLVFWAAGNWRRKRNSEESAE